MTAQVRLTPLTPALAPALRKVRVSDDQIAFSGQPAEALDDVSPTMEVHVILFAEQVAGMFRIDTAYHTTYPFAGPDTPGLRMFLIDKSLQGRGIATACCAVLRNYLREHYPHASSIYLTVNLTNKVARKVYLAGDFTDTGEQWPWGDAGPQNILRLDLRAL